MKAEDQAKLNELRKQKKDSAKQIYLQSTKSEAELKQELSQHNELVQAVKELATALQVNVEPPDFEPVVKELKNLEQLPDAFIDIKNMSIAVSGKIQKLLDYFNNTHKPEFRVKGINKLLEVIEQHNGTRDKELISKFADLTTYLNQLSETLKQGQDPEDFKPIRIVVGGDGTPLRFLTNMPSSRGGGGSSGGSSSGGLTDAELRASAVSVTETNSASIKTAVETIDNAISGSEMQVDVVGALPAGNNNIGDVDVASSALPTGAATLAEQQTQSASLSVLDDWDDGADSAKVVGNIASGSADSGNPVKIGGKYNSTMPTYTDGQRGNVEITTRGAAKTALFVDNSATAIAAVVTNADNVAESSIASHLQTASLGYVYDGSTWDRQRGDATDGTLVNLGSNNDVSLNAGTNLIGEVSTDSNTFALADAGSNTTRLPIDAAGSAISQQVRNNVYNGSTWDRMRGDTTGTYIISKPPDNDVTAITNYAKKYYTNAGAVTDGIVWSPASGKRWHIVSLFVNVSAAATVTFEDDLAAGDSAVLKMELAANSGTVIPFPKEYPLASGEDAADLLVTTSAGNVYITCVGYEI